MAHLIGTGYEKLLRDEPRREGMQMRLSRFRQSGKEFPVLEFEGRLLDACAVATSYDPIFFTTSGPDRLSAAARAGALPEMAPPTHPAWGAPLDRPGNCLRWIELP